jgi:hypothetical protein
LFCRYTNFDTNTTKVDFEYFFKSLKSCMMETNLWYTCVQKFSKKHNFDHNFFVLQSFGLKFSENLYTYYDYMFAKNWKNRSQLA